MGPRHSLVLEEPLLPVRESGPLLPLVLQLRPAHLGTTKVSLNLLPRELHINIELKLETP